MHNDQKSINQKVTIYGQSSGACHAAAHYVSPPSFTQAPNLFQNLVGMSGAFHSWCTMPMDASEQTFQLLYQNGCQARNDCGCLGSSSAESGSSAPEATEQQKICMRDWYFYSQFGCATCCDRRVVESVKNFVSKNDRSGINLTYYNIQTECTQYVSSKIQVHSKNSRLRQFSEYQIMQWQPNSVCRTGCDYSPVVDGRNILASMTETVVRGSPGKEYSGKPVLHGSCLDDGVEFMFWGNHQFSNGQQIQSENNFADYFRWAFAPNKKNPLNMTAAGWEKVVQEASQVFF